MNTSWMLAQMPKQLRAAIEANESLADWLQKGYTLEQIYTQEPILSSILQVMSRYERLVLESIVKQLGCEPFGWADLEKCCSPALFASQAKVGFVLLLRKGFVVSMKKTWGEHVYAIPEDMMDIWQNLLLDKLPAAAAGADTRETVGVPPLTADLFRLLCYVRRNEVTLTQKGALHKRHLQKLSERMSVNMQPLSAAGLSYTFADQYDPPLAVALDCALKLGLIAAADGRYVLCDSAADQWMSLPVAVQNERLYQLWKQQAAGRTAIMRHLVYALEQRSEYEPLTLKEVMKWLAASGVALNTEQMEHIWQEWIRSWAAPCAAFGWLECSETSVSWLVRPLPDKNKQVADEDREADGAFFVQPDFEVIVPPAESYEPLWELELFAELHKDDVASVYKISKESVLSALERGKTADGILQFLARFAIHGVPEHIEEALKQWERQFGKVAFSHVTLLRCSDPTVAGQLADHPKIAGYIVEQLGECDFIVAADKLEELRTCLGEAGYAPPKSTSGGMPSAVSRISVDSNEDELTERQGILISQLPAFYKMDPHLPDIHDLYPNLRDVPPMWWKDYRSYHSSTRKELARQAIEWRTALQLRRQGADTTFMPSRVQETRGTWHLFGLPFGGEARQEQGQEMMLVPEEWEEMKLIVPGINDK